MVAGNTLRLTGKPGFALAESIAYSQERLSH